MFIIENQLLLLIFFFVSGCVGTAFILRKPAGHRAWLLADLIWVLLGGLGALGAVLAGIYTSDIGRINRQIDIAYAATGAFDRDAARFRLGYCEAPDGPLIMQLCDKADFLSASTAENADLPLFIAVTGDVSPLQRLNFFGDDASESEMKDKMDMADDFNPDELLVFAALDAETESALAQLRQSNPRAAAEFAILASSYDTLIAQVSKLKAEWELLQQGRAILLVQIIAICLASFAVPFRIGKSVVELLNRQS